MNATIYHYISFLDDPEQNCDPLNKTPPLLRRCSEGLARRWQAVGDVPWRRSGRDPKKTVGFNDQTSGKIGI